MIFETIFLISLITLVMLVWFNSDAFVEYAKLVGGAKFFEVTEYEKQQEKIATLDYHGYLLENKNSFFIRLITCPLCFSVWMSVILTFVLTDSLWLAPSCNVAALILYKLTSNLLES
jgi:hypothetical protein|tara:strand:+ start:55 stop:405 length:351 start_codon:yes stop_codon:yes gene_type:complete